MTNDEKIQKLTWLIEEWEDEKDAHHDMCMRWRDYDDPGSDPGLQYEQEMKVDAAFEKIMDFCKANMIGNTQSYGNN